MWVRSRGRACPRRPGRGRRRHRGRCRRRGRRGCVCCRGLRVGRGVDDQRAAVRRCGHRAAHRDAHDLAAAHRPCAVSRPRRRAGRRRVCCARRRAACGAAWPACWWTASTAEGPAVAATPAAAISAAALKVPPAIRPAPAPAPPELRSTAAAGQPMGERPRNQRGRCGADGGARAVDQHPHRALAHAELAADVAVAPALDTDGQQRGPLLGGERGDLVERGPDRLAMLDLILEVEVPRRGAVEQREVGGARALQRVDRAVVHDPIEPGARVADLDACLQLLPGAHQRRLHDVLGT